MSNAVRVVKGILGALVVATVIYPLWFLTAWQVVVVGLVDGPGTLLAVAVAGMVAGVGLIVAHELGHAGAAWAVGLPRLSLTLVFLRIDWDGGRAKVRFNTRLRQLAGALWYVESGAGRWRVAATLAAGPLTNLAIAAACLGAAVAINPGPPAGAPPAARSAWRDVPLVWPGNACVAWLNVTGLVSLYLGTFTLIPGRSAGFRTDGGQLLDLARGRTVTP